MKLSEILSKVKALHLPEGSYVVFGSGPLAAAGIREANDIDLYVSKEIHEQKEKEGWQFLDKSGSDRPLVWDVFEMHDNWNFSSYNPTLVELFSRADVIEGVPFASLEDVRKWKVVSGRPKDLADIKLIDEYFSSR